MNTKIVLLIIRQDHKAALLGRGFRPISLVKKSSSILGLASAPFLLVKNPITHPLSFPYHFLLSPSLR